MTTGVSFTVRLPIRSTAGQRRVVARRVAVDDALTKHVLGELIESGKERSDPDLLEFSVDVLTEALEATAPERCVGPESVSDHIATAYRALSQYRDIRRTAERRGWAGDKNAMRSVARREDQGVHAHVPLGRKTAFGDDTEAMVDTLLDLVASGEGRVCVDIPSIGEFVVRGAGRRDLGTKATVRRASLEIRAERMYLALVVKHQVPTAPRTPRREFERIIRVAVTPATFVADDASIAAQHLLDEGSSLRDRTDEHRERIAQHRPAARSSRRLMDARHNFARQYAARVAERAEQEGAGVSVSIFGASTSWHPNLFGMNGRVRDMVVRNLSAQCARRSVAFWLERSDSNVPFRSCGHRPDIVVGVVEGHSVFGMCRACAANSVVGSA